ncbi:MAG TPA: PAS domain-containing protein, partial [Bacteroidia bacterium]|nr:PAS domain-containing protein [Bacteroidia bacterium]
MLNKLLLRQIQEYFGGLEGLPDNLTGFINAVNDTYENNLQDLVRLERVLNLSSSEMIELNNRLRNESEEVQKAHTELHTLFENIEVVFFSVDMINYRLLQISPACEKMYGYPVEEHFTNFNLWYDVILEEDRHIIDGNYPVMQAGQPFTQAYRIHHVNGDIRWLETKIFPTLDDEGKLLRIDGFTSDITAQKAAEEKAASTEVKFKLLIENSHDGIAMVDSNRRLKYNTPSVKRIFGYDPQELLDTDPVDYTHPEDVDELLAKLDRLKENGTTIKAEYRMRNKAGEYRWLRANIINMLHEPALQAIIINYEDITEMKATRAQLEFDRQNTTALINSTADLMWSVDANIRLTTANMHFLQSVKKVTGKELKTGDSILMESGLENNEVEKWKKRYKQALAGETISTEEHFSTKNYESWLEINMNPITENNKVMGVACFVRNITERKKTEILLFNNQKMLAEAQRVARFGSWEMDLANSDTLSSTSLQWSDEVFRIFGFEPGEVEVSNEFFSEMVHPDDRETVSKTFREAIKNGHSYQIEHRIILRTGEEKIIYEQAEIIKDDSNSRALKIIGTVQDITERKKSEHSLKQAEANFRNILENTDTSYILLDREAYIVSFNHLASEMAGRELGGTLRVGENYLDRMSPERRRQVVAAMQTVLNEKRQVSYEVEYKKPSGQSLWLYVRLHPIIHENSTVPGLSIAATDITEQKLAEQVLKQAEANLRNLLENTDTSYILLDKNATVLLMNRLAENLTTNELKHNVTVGRSYIAAMPPERQEAVEKAINYVLKEGRQVSYEVEYKNAGKSNLWLHVRMHPIIHDNLAVEGLSVAATDITERKNAEKLLQESNERYKIVTKATNDVIWDWDIVNDHMYRSENYAQVFGRLRPEDLLEKNWIINIHPDDRQRIVDSVAAKINDPTSILWEDEYRYYRSNGELAYIHDRGYILRDDNNQPV